MVLRIENPFYGRLGSSKCARVPSFGTFERELSAEYCRVLWSNSSFSNICETLFLPLIIQGFLEGAYAGYAIRGTPLFQAHFLPHQQMEKIDIYITVYRSINVLAIYSVKRVINSLKFSTVLLS